MTNIIVEGEFFGLICSIFANNICMPRIDKENYAITKRACNLYSTNEERSIY